MSVDYRVNICSPPGILRFIVIMPFMPQPCCCLNVSLPFSSGFVASKVPENLDAIIIGSGIGGLGLAVLLAKVGKKVLVLEQHDRAGGCCHTFTEKGFEFDVGEKDDSFLQYVTPNIKKIL